MAIYRHLEFPTDFQKYVLNKKESAKSYYRYFLARLSKMFQYKNLPDTIPHEILDRYLMNNGIACITKANDKLYVFYGNAGGPQDEYYRPTQFIIANPHIKVDGRDFQANVHIFGQPTDSDTCEGVLMRNDSEWQGLYPMIARYSFLMAENALTIRVADVMLRITALLTAPTDKERAAANEFLANLEDGKLSTIGEDPYFDGVQMQSPPSNNGSYLTQFIELQQYLKGSIFNELGLSANYNMKREAIGKGESTLDQDALMPLCENMLQCRREDLEKVNQLFGTNISVDFSSAWLTNVIENLNALSNATGSSTPASVGQPTGFGSGQEGDSSDELGTVGSASENKENVENGQNSMEKVETPEGRDRDDEEADEGRSTDAEGTEEVGGDKESDESENSESLINDLSQDPYTTKLFENVVDKIENPESFAPVGQPTIGKDGEEDADGGTESTSDDKEDLSKD